jgi:SET domain-containing protein
MPARRPWFELRRSTIQGTGAFAVRRIPEGKRLIEYTGERISADEASARYDDRRAKRHHTFLFELDEAWCIDARDFGSDARFINHSCEPNCEALIDGDRIFIHSRREIPEGAELTYDYRYVIDGPLDAATRKLYACKCGAKKCRGTIAVARPKKKAKKRAAKKRSAKNPR